MQPTQKAARLSSIVSRSLIVWESIMSKNITRSENNNIPIRQAKVKDCVEAAKLIFMTGEEIFKYVFYPEMDQTLIILRQLFQMEANEFTGSITGLLI